MGILDLGSVKGTNGQGVPTGGTTGQALVKSSGTDYATEWAALFDANNPSTQAFGDSAAVGTATVAARRDHKHAMPTLDSGTITFNGSYFDSQGYYSLSRLGKIIIISVVKPSIGSVPSGTVIATLPTGYRPAATEVLVVGFNQSSSLVGYFLVKSFGDVVSYLSITGQSWVSFSTAFVAE